MGNYRHEPARITGELPAFLNFLPRLLYGFSQRQPATQVNFREAPQDLLERDLLSGACEIALLYDLDLSDRLAIEKVAGLLPGGPEGASARARLVRLLVLTAVIFRQCGAKEGCRRCLARARALGSLSARQTILAALLPWVVASCALTGGSSPEGAPPTAAETATAEGNWSRAAKLWNKRIAGQGAESPRPFLEAARALALTALELARSAATREAVARGSTAS